MRFIFICLIAISCGQNAFARDWAEIKSSGIINVGLRPGAQVVYRPASSEKPGLMYEMVNDFADQNGLQVNIVEIPSFSSYWKDKDNAQPSNLGTPAIYDQIDIAAEIFTVTDLRRSRIHMTSYIENVELLFAQKKNQFRNYNELIGKTILTYESMSFYNLLINELNKRKLPYRQTHIPVENNSMENFKLPNNFKKDPAKINLLTFPKGIKAPATMSYQPVASGFIDVGINDAIGVLYRVFEVGQFKNILRPLFPAQSQRSQLAWGSRKQDKELNKHITNFMVQDKQSGRFSQRLEKYIGMSFDDYQRLIQMFD